MSAGCSVNGWPRKATTYEYPYARRATYLLGTAPYFQPGICTISRDWRQLVRGVEAVVHLVARTHVTDEFGPAALAAYRTTNVDLTRRLARAAKQEGVRRFVYMSSIKAVANASSIPLGEASSCRPVDSYGITKLEAEQTVRRQLLGSGTTYTILRPPLVYGPGVQGNFLRLLGLVQRGIPLPRIHNRRSMVHIENLVDAVALCLQNPAAMDQTFHVADRSAISTSDLVCNMAKGLGKRAHLIPVPSFLLRQLGKAIGRNEEIRRLADSLVVSSETIRRRLNWKPRIDLPTGIEQTSREFARTPWTLTTMRESAAEVSRAA